MIKLFSFTETARKLGITTHSLRTWHKNGKFVPCSTHQSPQGIVRMYSEEKIIKKLMEFEQEYREYEAETKRKEIELRRKLSALPRFKPPKKPKPLPQQLKLNGDKITAYITKHALKIGIKQAQGVILYDRWLKIIDNNKFAMYYEGEWYKTKHDAIAKAELMRQKKIKYFIAKSGKTKFKDRVGEFQEKIKVLENLNFE